MGFSSGSVTFQRYYLAGEHPTSLSETWLKAFEENAFGAETEVRSDGIETGWIVPTHYYDVDFSDESRVTVGRFIHVAIRVDRTNAPAAIVRSYRAQEEQAALFANGNGVLSAQDKRMAKEAAMDRAEKEARKGNFRRINAYPLLIDLQKGVLYFGALGAGASESLTTLFAKTFGVSLVAATMDELSCRMAERGKLTRELDDASPSFLVDPPNSDMDLPDFPGNDRSFLGREFLAWLWHAVQTSEGLVNTRLNQQIGLVICDSMKLNCCAEVTGTTTVTCDGPATAPEARAALSLGKLPTKLGLMVARGANEWSLQLDGKKASISRLILQRDEDDDPEAFLEGRFNQIVQAGQAVDELFDTFLHARLNAGWKNELGHMRQWAESFRSPTVPALQRATA